MKRHLPVPIFLSSIMLLLAGCRSDAGAPDDPGFPSAAGGPEVVIIPGGYSISAPFPNPFNPITAIEYTLPTASQVLLVVQNPLGDLVETLASGTHDAGRFRVEWDASKGGTRDLKGGTYFITLYAGGFTLSRTVNYAK
jgi:flagellar hook capping protein FlgD